MHSALLLFLCHPALSRMIVPLALLVALSVPGCPVTSGQRPAVVDRVLGTGDTRISPGVVVRREGKGLGTVQVIDVDLSAPGVRIEIAADEIARRGGRISGRSRTLPDWLRATGAVAGVNGGFFGRSTGPEHTEIVGLLKRAGRVRVAASGRRAKPSGTAYTRCALGFTRAGEPRMGWVTSKPGDPQSLRSHPSPEYGTTGTPWEVHQAVGCGPRLIRAGRIDVTYRGERLASPGALPRTFVSYGGPAGKRRLVLCAADGMEFEECARFLADYFRRRYGFACSEAMALDGGGSTQAAWLRNGQVIADPDPGTAVPTAILVHRD